MGSVCLVVLYLVLGMAPSGFAQGTVNFANRVSGYVDAPVYDTDAVTKLSGSAFRAQLYYGPIPDPGAFAAAGTPTPFLTNLLAGYFNGGIISLPGFAPSQTVYVQVRVWDSACGATYEQAVAAGGACRFKASAVLSVTLGGGPIPPPPLLGLTSFALFSPGQPQISNIANQFTPQNVPTAPIPFAVTDDLTPPGSLAVFASSSNSNLVPVANIAFGGSGSNRTLTLTPRTGQSGASTVRVFVSDGTLTSSKSFLLSVSNTPPSLSPIPNKTAIQNHLLSFSATATDASGPSQTLRFSLGLGTPAGAVVSPAGVFAWTPSPADVFSTSSVTLIVRDDGTPPLSNATTFAIVVPALSLDVFINEWMAGQTSIYPDPADGQYEDWFELFNAGASPVDLSGCYLSDDPANKPKYQFPLGTILAPGQYMLLWADNETNQPGWHVNFQLSQTGEALGLYLPGFVTIDEVVFGPQTTDISQGRWPDASATLISMPIATPGARNATGPILVEHPQSRTVNGGADVAFTVSAAGSPPLQYQWRRDGAVLPGATNSWLLLVNVQPADQGFYDVTVHNPYGTIASSNAVLTVVTPPFITGQPESQTATLGGAVTFTVSATGAPPPTIQWRHNGVNIPGATNASLILSNVQVSDGGTYSAVVASSAGAVLSSPAQLLLNVSSIAAGDYFSNRVAIAGVSGTRRGTNTFATREPGEPNPAGKAGGRSVWLTWTPPVSGIGVLRTAGSTFDTILGVYSGSVVNALQPLGSDDDQAGSLTSEVRVNVTAGSAYQILIDGAAGQSGTFILSWSLEATNVSIPVITNQPVGGIVRAGSNFFFTVGATAPGGGALFYQWKRAGNALTGAVASTYLVTNVGPSNVGTYTVRLTANGRTTESLPAVLEIGKAAARFSHDKVEDLLKPPVGQSLRNLMPPSIEWLLVGVGSGEFVPVTLGTVDSQVLENLDATTSPAEPAHCGVTGGASKFYGLTPLTAGVLVIDTSGSSFNTVLAVYTGPTTYTDPFTFWSSLQPVACNNDRTSTDLTSQVSFDAEAGASYIIAIDGVGQSRGSIHLNWRLIPVPPTLPFSDARQLIRVGSDITLSNPPPASITGPIYQWLHKGVNMPGASNAVFYLCNAQLEDAGSYTVVARNPANTASTSSIAARLAVGEFRYSKGPSGFSVTARASHVINVDGSTDLKSWTPLTSKLPALSPWNHAVSPIPVNTQRYYRMTLAP